MCSKWMDLDRWNELAFSCRSVNVISPMYLRFVSRPSNRPIYHCGTVNRFLNDFPGHEGARSVQDLVPEDNPIVICAGEAGELRGNSLTRRAEICSSSSVSRLLNKNDTLYAPFLRCNNFQASAEPST